MEATLTKKEEIQLFFNKQDNKYRKLKVTIAGKQKTLFLGAGTQQICYLAPRSRSRGYVFYDFESVTKITYPPGSAEFQASFDEVAYNRKMVRKYQKLAAKASFNNGWLEKIRNANPDISLYDNGITTGVSIEGKCISLKSLERYCGIGVINNFKKAIVKRETYSSYRFDYCGYDGSLHVWLDEEGNPRASFDKEYRNCGNGYYYSLINDDTFIGYDID